LLTILISIILSEISYLKLIWREFSKK